MTQKSPADAQRHYVESIPLVSSRYSEGIDRTTNWHARSISAQAIANHKEGTMKALNSGAREKGLAGISDEEWKRLSKEKGANSIGNGMQLASGKYLTNVTPTMNAAISAINSAPARTTDYKTNIANRLIKVIEAEKRAAGKL